jgi:PAS domain S-box-containing protein
MNIDAKNATAPVDRVQTSPDVPVSILIVDDEPKNLAVLETVLEDPSYRLVRAGSGEQALLALMADEFAVLVLDIRMPGMTGIELAQMIKERKKTARVPIIFLTAYDAGDQHLLEGYGSGAVDYLHKPVNAAVLRSKVAVFAELHRKTSALALANVSLLAEVAERRRAEIQLRELNETLDQRVMERTRALHTSDERVRLATAATQLGIWSWQPAEDSVTWENDWPCEILGVARSEGPVTMARFAAEFLVPDDQPTFEQAAAQAIQGDGLLFEGRMRAPDGALRWIEFQGKAVASAEGLAPRLIGTARDITDRMQAQQSLRERERLLSTVTSAARIGLAVVGPGYAYRYANEAYLQMRDAGTSSDAIIGRSVFDVNPDVWAQVKPHLDQAFAGQRVTYETTLPVPQGGAGSQFCAVFYEPHIDRQGQPTVVVVLVDITDLRRMEAQLREADRRKDEFLATLAHELRNPLAPVRNAVHILEKMGPASPELQWARGVIERQVQAMTRLIDDLMDVSRISRGKIHLRRQRVELVTVLHDAGICSPA